MLRHREERGDCDLTDLMWDDYGLDYDKSKEPNMSDDKSKVITVIAYRLVCYETCHHGWVGRPPKPVFACFSDLTFPVCRRT
eukprot:3738746-Heterocapsa_arctica.AAC.1